MRSRWLFGVLALLACVSAFAAPFRLTDIRRIVQLSDPQLSPDGSLVALVVAVPVWSGDKVATRIDVVTVAHGGERDLSKGLDDVSMPRWSPDGRRLAFLAQDPHGKTQQVYVVRVDGDARRPTRITRAPRGVVAFSWSPDGRRIAWISQDPDHDAGQGASQAKVFEVTDGSYLLRHAVAPWQLWVAPSGGGAASRLTEGSFSLWTNQQDDQGGASAPVWSADGRSITFTMFPGPYWAPSYRSVIARVPASGVTTHPTVLVNAEGSRVFSYAPRGSGYACMRVRDGDLNNGTTVYVHRNGIDDDAAAALDRDFNAYAWLPGGNELLLEGFVGTSSGLWVQPLGGNARRLALGDVNPSEDYPGETLSVARNGEIAFVGSTGSRPSELYVLRSTDSAPRRLTHFNAWSDALELGRTVPVNWSFDGFDEDGALTYPVGYQQGSTYPLVIVVHGGPQWASTVEFDPLSQLLAAAGFLVFQPNYRGSINLGNRYQHAVYRDTGQGPAGDVMAGLRAVEALGVVDESRIGISGWSYGGYMTDWLTSHFDIWKAAVSGAALTDWVMDYSISYYLQGDAYFFGGTAWTPSTWRMTREQSPITYAASVKTPTLIMGDVGDVNVPLVNSYEWFHALKARGVPVRFFAYPVDTHFPEGIVEETDVYRRWVAWMTQYLKSGTSTPDAQ